MKETTKKKILIQKSQNLIQKSQKFDSENTELSNERDDKNFNLIQKSTKAELAKFIKLELNL